MSALALNLRSFAHEHDDIPAFHAAYLVATFLAAAVLNLGFFAVLIAGHMALDYVKYREVHQYGIRVTIKAMILESITDIALFLVALTFGVYLSHTYVLAAFSGLIRSELTLLRALGTLLPKVAILEHMIVIALDVHAYMHNVEPALRGKFTAVQTWSLRFSVLSILLLAGSIALFWGDEETLMKILVQELVPAL